MKRIVIFSALVACFVIASAMPPFFKTFKENYKLKDDSALAKANCSVCHATAKGGKLNPYGVDLEKEMKAQKQKTLTKEVLAKVEGLDSDKDGVKNIDEIKKDTQPGVK